MWYSLSHSSSITLQNENYVKSYVSLLPFEKIIPGVCTTHILGRGTCHREGYRFQDIDIKNGINFHNFSIRNGANCQDFGIKYKVKLRTYCFEKLA